MNTFDEILKSILKTVEDNPTANIDGLLAAKMTELGISAENKKLQQETSRYIDAFDEMNKKLQEAKDQGVTRKQWIQDEIIAIADKHQLNDEQKEQLFNSLAHGFNDSINNSNTDK